MEIKIGDKVTRRIGPTGQHVDMELTVTALDDRFIHCGIPGGIGDPKVSSSQGWKFDRTFGYEVDEEIGWGLHHEGKIVTGSYLIFDE